MNTTSKRASSMEANNSPKRVKKECSYGEKCYRRNPAHFREFSHPHLESILDVSTNGDYVIPEHLSLQKFQVLEQLEVIVEKQLYEPKNRTDSNISSQSTTRVDQPTQSTSKYDDTGTTSFINLTKSTETPPSSSKNVTNTAIVSNLIVHSNEPNKPPIEKDKTSSKGGESERKDRDSKKVEAESSTSVTSNVRGPDYVPIIPPTRRAEDYLKVVLPRGKMAAKHAASAPYHIFYTTIADCKETHDQPYSITFLEILDSSLGELKCSLQINFMVDIAWLLAQYYFAGYSQKKLTILYGEECQDLKDISSKKPHVEAHKVAMATPFAKHHTKMMLLCYEDGSLRVLVSTANLYLDDWENRAQGLWLSPSCPPLPPGSMPHEGDSPTSFKKSLLKYLHHYHLPQLTCYIDRVRAADMSHINVFLVASAPGSHFDQDWALTRVGSLLRQHCCIPADDSRSWPLVAQASSLGSYGKDAKLWLTGDFLHYFTKIKNQPQILSQPPELQLIYPSLENVRQSHDGLLGGGCLPYSAEAHAKQPWLNQYLFQWRAYHTNRNRAMPHIKSYTRVDRGGRTAAFYLLTSANVSKAAWGQINKGNGALRGMSYEAGVLLLPTFVIGENFFPLTPGSKNRLVIPYDLPPTRYSSEMTPWVQDYLHT